MKTVLFPIRCDNFVAGNKGFLFVLPLSATCFQLSYAVVDALLWLGMRDMINELRRSHGLTSVRSFRHLAKVFVPHTYIWSPSLCPKPNGMQNMVPAGTDHNGVLVE